MLNKVQKRILSFFLRYPHEAYMLINTHFDFTDEFLKKYDKVIDWKKMAKNSLMNNADFIERFEDKLNWYALSESFNLIWTEEILERYKDRLNWSSKNKDENGETYFWNFSNNRGFTWTIERIEKYKEYLDWFDFHSNLGDFWTEEMIEKYAGALIWELFYPRSKQPFSKKFIEKYITMTEKPWLKLGIVHCPELIIKYADDIEWSVVSLSEQLPWSKEFIDMWFSRLDKSQLARNSKAIHNMEMFEYLRKKWDDDMKYFYLSCCPGNFWTRELVEKYKDEWDWSCMSGNTALPWSVEFIETYRGKWRFRNQETAALIKDGRRDFFNPGLSYNWAIPWSIQLIEKYEEEWDIEYLFCNVAIWHKAFSEQVNEELVEFFFRIHC